MGNLCGLPQVNDHVRSSSGSGRVGESPGAGRAAIAAPGQEQYCDTTTNAPAASVGTQQSRTPQPHSSGQHAGAGAQHPSVSGSTTTTTTTRETRENEKGDGLMPLGQPAIHEQYPLPRHHTSSSNSGHHEDFSPPQTVPLSWTKGKLIGAGAFGRVFQGLDDDTGQIVAVKQVALTKDETLKGRVAEHVRALEAEVAVLLQLNHRNIVRYLGTERTEDTLNIFLEYVPGGSIASMIEKFGPLKTSVIRMYAQQILKGLEYLHQKKIMHRDIKGANILVDGRGTVKLADFGASKKIENLATVGSGSKSIRGTPYWMAPEVIKQTGHGRPADIWSLACVVIEMATGKPPWSNCHTQVAAMFHIASTKEPPPLPEHLPPEAKDFLLLCFNRVPKDRPNATKLLRHPWMAGCGSTQPSPMKALPVPTPLPQSQPAPPKQGSEQEHGQRHAAPHQHSEAQPSDSEIGLEGAGSNTGPHGLPPLVPGARASGHQHSQHEPNQQQQQQQAPQSSAPAAPNPANAAPSPAPQPLFAGPTPITTNSAKAAAGGVSGRAPSHTPPALVTQPQYTPPQQQQQQQQQPRGAPAAPVRPTPPTAAAAAGASSPAPTPPAAAATPSPALTGPTGPPCPPAAPTSGPPKHTYTPTRTHYTPAPSAPGAGGAGITAQGPAVHTRVPSGGVLAAHRGVQHLPGPTALVGLAQKRTAAPAPGTAGTASPLKGAQLRSMPIPRPSPHMFPQPRPQPQQQQQQPAQSHLQLQPQMVQQQPPLQPQQQPLQQPHLHQQPPKQPLQQGPVPRAALVSTDFNPMEEPCWGAPGKQRGGDQAGGLQQHKLHLPPHNADKDVPAPVSARRPTGVAAINRPGAGKETAAAAAGVVGNAQQQQQQQQQRRMYPGPPPLRVPGSQPAHMDQGPFGQERDAMPVKDSKMQNWRDGLIKEMASKRQGGFRPPPGAAAAATAK